MTTLHRSEGLLQIEPNKYYVLVDPEISNLTRALLPRFIRQRLNRQRYAAHISVARNEPTTDSVPEQTIHFQYNPQPIVGLTYVWLQVYSEDLTNIRIQLGLQPSSHISRPPDGTDCFHITIGNFK